MKSTAVGVGSPERVPRAFPEPWLLYPGPLGGSRAFGIFCSWLCLPVSVQCVALEPVRGLLVESFIVITWPVVRENRGLKLMLILESYSREPFLEGDKRQKEYQQPGSVLMWMLWKMISGSVGPSKGIRLQSTVKVKTTNSL